MAGTTVTCSLCDFEKWAAMPSMIGDIAYEHAKKHKEKNQ